VADDEYDRNRGANGSEWREYKRLLLSNIDRVIKDIEGLNTKIESIKNTDLPAIKVDIAMLQIKSGMWGALAGLVVALGAVFLTLLKH